MKFRSAYADHDIGYRHSSAGSCYRDVFQLDPENHVLVKVGDRNQYEEIQSFADSVDIYKILEKCSLLRASGNDEMADMLLNVRQGLSVDASAHPDFMDMHNALARGKELYEGLPPDQRVKFTFSQFLEFASNPDNYKKVGDNAVSDQQDRANLTGDNAQNGGVLNES